MSDLFAGIEGQDQVTGYLNSVLHSGQATHAYLIAGAPGSRHEEIALRFAAALVACAQPGSLNDAEYETALGGLHPDLHYIEPKGASVYLVEQLREVVRDVGLAPVRSSRKVYIVGQANRLNESSANAFLKTLEEPPGDVAIILLAPNAASVLPTLVSRCQVLTCNTPQGHEASNAQAADLLLRLAQGVGARAVFDEAARIVTASEEGNDELAARQAKQLEESADYLSAPARKELEAAHKRELTARQRNALLQQVGMVRSCLRDCLLIAEGAQQLAGDASPAVVQLAGSVSGAQLLQAVKACEQAQERISYNVTSQLAIEAMLLEIKEALCPR